MEIRCEEKYLINLSVVKIKMNLRENSQLITTTQQEKFVVFYAIVAIKQ